MREAIAAAGAVLVPMIVCVSVLLSAAQGHAQIADMNGTYVGVESAQGITLRIAPGGRGYQGEIIAQSGGRAAIDAEAAGGGAIGELALQGRPGLVRFSPRPLGLSMVWMPKGQGGAPVAQEAVVYSFLRQGLSVPSRPPGYVEPPYPGADRADPIGFLHSYEFWDADAAARTYDLINDKFRVIMRTYPALHGDILWKLCKATVAPQQLGNALRGQGVTCGQLDSGMKAAQASGGFARFKQRLHSERADALTAVECARGIHTQRVCSQAAQRTQQAAASLDTVASILRGL